MTEAAVTDILDHDMLRTEANLLSKSLIDPRVLSCLPCLKIAV